MKSKLTLLLLIALLSCQSAFCQKWIKISCGGEFSLGLKADGSLWAWGNNNNGQLGIGGTNASGYPARIGKDKDWKEISAGGAYSMAIKNNGTLWGWGDCTYGQSGLGSGSNINDEPQQVGTDSDWEKVVSSYASTFIIKKSGKMYCTGFNFFGELGDSSNDNIFTPKPVWGNFLFKDVASGSLHTVAITTDGKMWAWGYGSQGELGQGIPKNSIYPIEVGKDSDWLSVKAGAQYSIALKSNGTMWSWGTNSKGQIGQGNVSYSMVPMQINADNRWRFITAGSEFAFAIKADSTLYGWGDNAKGELGQSTSTFISTPVKIDSSKDWIYISAAATYVVNQTDPRPLGHHAIGIKSGYNGYCGAGINNYSQLGNSDTATRNPFDCTLGLKSAIHAEHAAINDAEIFPNPTSGIITINTGNSMDRNYQITITDITGRVYESRQDINYKTLTLNLSGYPKGLYFLKLNSDKMALSKKIIVQ
jgi:alpha-tubulin suppressor-like RCC1 family protein